MQKLRKSIAVVVLFAFLLANGSTPAAIYARQIEATTGTVASEQSAAGTEETGGTTVKTEGTAVQGTAVETTSSVSTTAANKPAAEQTTATTPAVTNAATPAAATAASEPTAATNAATPTAATAASEPTAATNAATPAATTTANKPAAEQTAAAASTTAAAAASQTAVTTAAPTSGEETAAAVTKTSEQPVAVQAAMHVDGVYDPEAAQAAGEALADTSSANGQWPSENDARALLTAAKHNVTVSPSTNVGTDHPQNPGDVMLFKTIENVGLNQWKIHLRVEGRNAQIPSCTVLVFDRSGSMSHEDSDGNVKIKLAKKAAKALVGKLLADSSLGNEVALLSFGDDVKLNLGFSTSAKKLNAAIDGMKANGGTFTQAALHVAHQLIAAKKQANGTKEAVYNIILLSDGLPTYGCKINGNILSESRYFDVVYLYVGSQAYKYRNEYFNVSTTGQPGYIYDDYLNVQSNKYKKYGYGRSRYAYVDPSDIYDTDPIIDVANGAIDEASYFRNDTSIPVRALYTVGLNTKNGKKVLEAIADPGRAHYTDSSAQLDSIFAQIANEILSAVKQATVNDPMGHGFVIMPGQTLPEGVTPAADGKSLTWKFNGLEQPVAGQPGVWYSEISYNVTIDNDILTAQAVSGKPNYYYTNNETGIQFTDINNTTNGGKFPVPSANPVLYKIKKVVKDLSGNDITAGTSEAFKFHVTGTDYDQTYSIVPSNGDSTSLLTNLRTYAKYTVNELNTSSHYTTTYTVGHLGETGEHRNYFEVWDQAQPDVYITVTNQQKPGSIVLTKNLVQRPMLLRSASADEKIAFAFTIKGPGGYSRNVTLPDSSGNWSVTLNNLAWGNYTITETPVSGYSTTTSIDGGSPKTGYSVTINIGREQALQRAVTFTNTAEQYYEVTATKQWVGSGAAAAVSLQLWREDPDGTGSGRTIKIGNPVTLPTGSQSTQSCTWTQNEYPEIIRYNQAGKAYRYYVTESGAPGGYISVADGLLVKNIKIPGLSFAFTKVLTGRPLKADEFTFSYYKSNAAGEKLGTALGQVSNGADGSCSLSYVNNALTAAGTWYILLEEDKGSLGGVTYDLSAYLLTVETSIGTDGQARTQVTNIQKVTPNGLQDVTAVTFTNVYHASGSWQPEVTKSLTGKKLEAGKYSFVLKEGTNTLQTVSNTADGKIPFTAISYNETGKHTYTIHEEKGSLGGITYDTHTVTVTVTVTDDGNGQLTAAASYSGDKIFRNSYTSSGTWSPVITKSLTGKTLEANKFSFVVTENGKTVSTGTNKADGTVAFTPISYALADKGVHTYKIKEVQGTLGGVTYDTHVVTATVTVTDDGSGNLSASASYTGSTNFTNSYAASGSWAPVITKALTGKTLQANKFTFLVTENGNQVSTGTNKADGTVTFTPITYGLKDKGKHTYKITEVKGALGGVTYDTHEVTATVTVTDDGSGKLNAAATYTGSTKFTNTYTSKGSWAPVITKTLANKTLAAKMFSFVVTENGKEVSRGTNNANGTVTFTPISYGLADKGVHTYKITEVKGTLGGVTYDTHEVTATVTVTDDGLGNMNAAATYTGSTNFTNTYASKGSWAPVITKTLANKTLAAKMFSFVVTENGKTVSTGTNNANGTVTFTPISYALKDKGVHTYKITEVKGTLGGVTYDTHEVTATVTVTDDGSGNLSAKASYTGSTNFTNRYAASGSWVPVITKALTGKTLEANKFTFLVTENGSQVSTGTNKADGTVTFTPITYGLADKGEHIYKITEVQGTLGGVTYDTHVVTATVNVTDDGSGKLNAAASYTGSTKFTNTYASSGTWAPVITKTLANKTLAAKMFNFVVTENGKEVSRGTNNANGTVTFTPIRYALEDKGVHTYKITEVQGTLGGVTYDTHEVTAKVTVTDDGLGNMKAAATYTGATNFTNTYASKGTWAPVITKTLTNKTLAAKMFSFVVTENGKTVSTGTNNANGTVTFTPISYALKDKGEHIYKITEVKGTLGGVTYDTHEVIAKVTVTDDGSGNLSASATYTGATNFTNTYTSKGSWAPAITKTLTGKTLAAKMFTFLVTENGKTVSTGTNNANGTVTFTPISYALKDKGVHTYKITEVQGALGGVTYDTHEVTATVTVTDDGSGKMNAAAVYEGSQTFTNSYAASGSWQPAITKTLKNKTLEANKFTFILKEGTNTLQTKQNTADGKVPFEAITYNKAGTYNYTITEQKGSLGGIAYDAHTVKVKVVVTDKGDGTMTVTPTYEGKPAFENVYSATGGFTPAVTKVLRNKTLGDGWFTFTLKEGTKLLQTVSNKADGTIPFAEIPYKLSDVGTHTYTIQEKAGQVAGVTYDEHSITITVKVKDKGDGTLVNEVTYSGGQSFTNTYTASGKWTPLVTKALTGKTLEAGKYSFVLKEGTKTLQTVSNKADGTIPFTAVTYDLSKAGTHTYTIQEVKGTLGGITYDEHSVTVTVTAKDNGDGTMTVTPVYSGARQFTNSYHASGIWQPEITKTLKNKTLEANKFTFILKEGTNTLQTKQNTADGKVPFEAITYNKAGTYNYTITEETGSLGGIVYDTHIVKVKVVVTDNGDGTMTVTPTYDGAQLFSNVYAPSGTFTPNVTKILTNKTLGDDWFTFTLKEGTTPLQTVKNKANGEIPFKAITYTKAGTYHYTIQETAGQVAGVTNSTQTIKITVTVTDDGSGTLKVSPVYEGGKVFTNVYSATGGFTPVVTKVLTNKILGDGWFTFTLKEGNNTLQTVSNKADGTIPFSKIPYTLEDVGTHTYIIQEKAGQVPGVTYDAHSVTITVKVKDKGDGTLVNEVTYSGGKSFTNTYAASGTWSPVITKSLTGKPLAKDMFTFVVTENGREVSRGTNNANGTVTFTPIAYQLKDKGEHTYKITEVKGTLGGVTYDRHVVTAKVTVTDDGRGHMNAAAAYTGSTNFTNTYTSKGSWAPVITKTLANKTLAAKMFTFLVTENGMEVSRGTNNANGTVTFTPITYGLEDKGQHIYKITEVQGTLGGVTYDTHEVTATVTVTDDGSGKMNASASYTGSTNFTNTYTSKGSWVPAITKTLTGKPLAAKMFTFLVTENGSQVSTGTNKADGTVAFTPITYGLADKGVHTYKITEVQGALGGVTYDTHEVTATVTVTDNGSGKMNASAVYEGSQTFTNSYAASGSWQPAITKSLKNKALRAEMFIFTLKEGTKTLQTKLNKLNGQVPFEPITYSKAGTYYYTITEQQGSLGGIAYDTHSVKVKVIVTDNGNGTMTVTPTYDGKLAFENVYSATGGFTPEVTKVLRNKTLGDGWFTFTLKEGTKTLQTVSNKADGTIPFSKIPYKLSDVGTHTYIIQEKAGQVAGVTYDEHSVTITVKVKDKGDGTLVNEVTYSGDRTFTNTYAASGKWTPQVTKTLTGKTLEAGKYSFALKEGTKTLQTVSNKADGTIPFSEVKYDLSTAGTHTYTIQEVKGTLGGITYDEHSVTVTVTAKDNGDGTMTVTPVYSGDQKFTNSYHANGSWEPAITKILKNKTLEANKFTFILKEGTNTLQTVKNTADGKVPFKAITYNKAGTYNYTITEEKGSLGGIVYDTHSVNVKVIVTDNGNGTMTVTPTYDGAQLFSNVYAPSGTFTPNVTKILTNKTLEDGWFTFTLKEGTTPLQTVKNKANGEIPFKAITYTKAGTYHYTIQETAGQVAGVTNSTQTIKITVTVTDDGNGKLKASPVYEGGKVFTNVYSATGGFTPTVTKVLTNKTLGDGWFTFTLKEGNNTLQTVSNKADGTIPFSKIPYDLSDVGTHTYTIQEKAGQVAGVTYDAHRITITVKVKDNGYGTLVNEVTYSGGKSFKNTYAASGEWTPLVTKALTGKTLEAGKYSFVLSEGKTRLQTVANLADGTIPFTAVKYDLSAAGTHTYTIEEVKGTLGGITYDTHKVTVTVKVSDNGDGTMTVKPVYTGDQQFTNSYHAKGTFTPEVTKALQYKALEAGKYSFVLAEGRTALQTVANLADGSIPFKAITYDKAGTYIYTIYEKQGTDPSIVYDNHKVTLTVKVSDNGDGTMTVKPTYEGKTQFTNVYVAEGQWQPVLKKIFKAGGRALQAGEFTFTLSGSDGSKRTAKNDQGGNIVFAPLTYSAKDIGKVFTYTISEVNGGKPGITYDKADLVYRLKVVDLGGKLGIEMLETPKNEAFTNSYHAKGSIRFEAVKELDGRALGDNAFSFTLTRRDGAPFLILDGGKLKKVTSLSGANLANGKVYFNSDVYFTEEDIGETLVFDAKENVPAKPEANMQYSRKTVTFEVKVADNGDGTLSVTQTKQPAKALTFVNVYTANGSWTPTVDKTLNGRTLTDGAFAFALKQNGKTLETAENLKDGSVTFKAIPYTQDDAGKTYTYTIEEIIPQKPENGMTYDRAAVTVKVSVRDAGGGKLDVRAEYMGGKTGFVNTYKASGSYAAEVTKALTGRALKNHEFTFDLKGAGQALRAQNDRNGKVTFPALSFDEKAIGKTFTYLITEEVPQTPEPGMTYDRLAVTLTLKVLDLGGGKLGFDAVYSGDTEFNNTYKAAGGFTLTLDKALTGRALRDGEFTFEMKDENGKTYTAKNGADGKIRFGEVRFDQSAIGKTFFYTVTEQNPAPPEPGMTYDAGAVRVKVTVNDKGGGKLDVRTETVGMKRSFTNVYKAEGQWAPELTKKLVGRNLKDKEFTFELREGGKLLTTGYNQADGKIVFGALNFTEKAIGKTFTYRVTEVKPARPLARMTYDAKVITIELKVTDAGAGRLAFETVYRDGVRTFENTYEPLRTDVTAEKIWSGGPASHPQILLQLYRNGVAFGQPVAITEGKYTWRGLAAEDIDMTPYRFTVREVEVPDGYEASYSKDGLTVTNTYQEITKTGEKPAAGILSAFALLGAAAAGFALRRGLKKRKED